MLYEVITRDDAVGRGQMPGQAVEKIVDEAALVQGEEPGPLRGVEGMLVVVDLQASYNFV